MNIDISKLVVELIVAVVTIIIGRVLVPYLNAKLGTDKMKYLCDFIEKAERAAKEQFSDNTEKRNYVLTAMINKANSLGIDIDYDEARLYLEGIYNTFKDEINK